MSLKKNNWIGPLAFIYVLGLGGAVYFGAIDLTDEDLTSTVGSLPNVIVEDSRLGEDSSTENLEVVAGRLLTPASSHPCKHNDCFEIAAVGNWAESIGVGFSTLDLADTSGEAAVPFSDALQRSAVPKRPMPHATKPDEFSAPYVWAANANGSIDVELNPKVEPESFVMLADVMFDFGKATLVPEGVALLKSVAQNLQSVEKLEIIGHTDSIGTEDANFRLGQDRANAVLSWLAENGYVEGTQVFTLSLGETKPMVANSLPDGSDNPKGRAMNRRVELLIVDK